MEQIESDLCVSFNHPKKPQFHDQAYVQLLRILNDDMPKEIQI